MPLELSVSPSRTGAALRRAAPWLLMAMGAATLLGEWAWQQRAAKREAAIAAVAQGQRLDCRQAPAGLMGGADLCGDARYRFAMALAALRQGHADDALDAFRALSDHAQVGLAARYNAAGVLMRQAAPLREGSNPGQALPLIELAKESYREVLRQDPSHWAARYNLERAQRWIPDVDAEEPPLGAPQRAERAATTLRGVAQGLP